MFIIAPYVRGCDYCNQCKTAGICVKAVDEDPVNKWWEIAQSADGIILATPSHYANVTVEMKSFIDRVGIMAENSGKLKGKVGASIIALHRGGATCIYDSVYFLSLLLFFYNNVFYKLFIIIIISD